jgi:hypothetical protein
LEKAINKVVRQRGMITIDGPTDQDFNLYIRLRILVEAALDKVSLDKSPGYPLNLEYANNAAAIAGARLEIVGATIARLLLWSNPDTPFEILALNPGALVLSGLKDPSSIFIKDEPHPRRKHVEGRFRCITPVSLVDQLCESVWFGESSERLRDEERIYVNGSSVGIGFTDSQTKEFITVVNAFTEKFGDPVTDDCSGFDGLHTIQTLLATSEIDKRTHTSTRGTLVKWNLCNRRWALACANSSVVVGSLVYSRTNPGMLDSGSKDTSRRNTLLKNLYSNYLGLQSGQELDAVTANGDDGIMWGIHDLPAYLKAADKAGIRLRDVTRQSNSLDFCSHNYDCVTGLASLTSWHKAVFRLATKKVPYDDAMQVANEVRHSDAYPRVLAFINRVTD